MSFRGDYCDLSTHLWGVKHVVKERKGKARKVIKTPSQSLCFNFHIFSPLSPPFSAVFFLTAPKAILCACQMDKPLSQMFR